MKSRDRHILLLAPGCDGTDVGEAWSSFQWVRGLALRHRVTVLTYIKRNRPALAPQLPGVEVIEWRDWPIVGRFERLNSGMKPGYIGFYWKTRRWLKAALRHRKFDLIHQISPLALRYPSPAAGLGVPLIIGPLAGSIPTPPAFADELRHAAWFTRLRTIDHWRLRHDPLLKRSYESADVVIGVAPYVRELMSRLSIQRFEVLSETGVSALPPMGARAASDGRIRLLFVGRVVRAKGARDAVRAMAHLQDLPQVTLDIVGDGEDLLACKREAEELRVGERVKFHGRLPRADVDAFYRRADVFLFPSLREPSGNAVLEALSHGLAVIVADNGGPAFAAGESCGIRVTPTNPTQYARDLAQAVRQLASDPLRLAKMQAASRDRVAEKFLWEQKIDWMCRLYQDLIAAPSREQPESLAAPDPAASPLLQISHAD